MKPVQAFLLISIFLFVSDLLMESDGEDCVDQAYDATVNENVYFSEVFHKYSTQKEFRHRTETLFA